MTRSARLPAVCMATRCARGAILRSCPDHLFTMVFVRQFQLVCCTVHQCGHYKLCSSPPGSPVEPPAFSMAEPASLCCFCPNPDRADELQKEISFIMKKVVQEQLDHIKPDGDYMQNVQKNYVTEQIRSQVFQWKAQVCNASCKLNHAPLSEQLPMQSAILQKLSEPIALCHDLSRWRSVT